MIKKPLVSILILTYNRSDLLKICLKSILKSDYLNLEFVVSDNGSSEDIAGFVKKEFPKQDIQVVRLERNRGLTGGFNYGFKFCKGKYVMLLSNDTKIERKAISYMVGICERDLSVGIVSPKIIQMRNSQYLHHAGSFLTLTGFLYHYGILQNKEDSNYQQSYYIFSCNGAGFLIRRKAASKSKLFDEDFFYFYDESDLCHRIWLAGYSVVYCPQANLWHLWSATMQGANPKIWYYSHRNHISSFIMNLSVPYLILFLVNFNLILIAWFFINLLQLKLDNCLSLPRAYLWHLVHFRETWKKRKFVQSKIRKISDAEIFKKSLVSPDWKYYFVHLNINLNFQDMQLPDRVLYKG